MLLYSVKVGTYVYHCSHMNSARFQYYKLQPQRQVTQLARAQFSHSTAWLDRRMGVGSYHIVTTALWPSQCVL
jgi:hypothetical protein